MDSAAIERPRPRSLLQHQRVRRLVIAFARVPASSAFVADDHPFPRTEIALVMVVEASESGGLSGVE